MSAPVRRRGRLVLKLAVPLQRHLVVVLPGIMGSRLRFGRGRRAPVWDPDDAVGMLTWASRSPSDNRDIFDVPPSVIADPMNPLNGHPGVSRNYYGFLINELANLFGHGARLTPGGYVHVHPIGYPWTKSITVCAAHVNREIRRLIRHY